MSHSNLKYIKKILTCRNRVCSTFWQNVRKVSKGLKRLLLWFRSVSLHRNFSLMIRTAITAACFLYFHLYNATLCISKTHQKLSHVLNMKHTGMLHHLHTPHTLHSGGGTL